LKSVRDLSFYFWIFLIFVASQITATFLHIRFVGSSVMIIEPFWQYLDPQILKTDLLRGLFFLHSQPPLFNAFLGVILKLFPQHYEQAFAWVFRAFSLGTLLLMGSIMRKMAIDQILIFIFCALFALFPNFLVYTNLLFYTLPVAFLLLLSCFFLQQFLETQRMKFAVLFTSTTGIIMLTRSIYHLIWFVLCAAVIFFLIDANRRRIFLRASIVPVLLVILLYAKNSALVGSFGPSSWMGMNLARGWTLPNESMRNLNAFLEPEEIRRLSDYHKINSEWLVGPFMPPADYRDLGYFRNDVSSFYHAAISAPEKRSSIPNLSHPNFNHYDYAKISRKMLDADCAIILEYPQKYFARVLLGFEMYLQPATGPSWFLVQSYNYYATQNYADLLTKFLFQGRRIELARGYIPLNSFYLVFPILIIFGIKKTFSKGDKNQIIFAYLTLTVLWVAMITNLLEFGENNRIRFETDPLIVILLAAALQSLYRFFRKGLLRRSSPIVVESP
jgi:hypothetical protein